MSWYDKQRRNKIANRIAIFASLWNLFAFAWFIDYHPWWSIYFFFGMISTAFVSENIGWGMYD